MELLLLVFLSVMVLPVYALTTAAGSHSAASVIEHALKHNIKPDIARWGGWVVCWVAGWVVARGTALKHSIKPDVMPAFAPRAVTLAPSKPSLNC